jgi:hypothetical protein
MIALEDLELIATWKEDLRDRLARAMLIYETAGLGREDIVRLGQEVASFTNVVEVLKQGLRDDLSSREI